MQHTESYKYQIIFNLRKHGELSISKLMEIILGGKGFSGCTAEGDFCRIILDMARIKFITISSSNNDLANIVKDNYEEEGYASLADGYNFALKINPEYTYIKLTDFYFRMQDAFGFSITDKLSKRRRYNESIFGVINKDLKTQVFVIMPFNNNMDPVYQDHILKVCNKIGYECKRADDIYAPNIIINDIYSMISNSDVIICDCTNKNANVFYELGIAHALGKGAICITQKDGDIPFDIKQLRYIKYEYTPRGMNDFEEKLEKYLALAMSDVLSDRYYW